MRQKELESLCNAFRVMEAQGYTDAETGKTTPFDPTIAAALKMLLFTGARCMEILTRKWEYIDMARGIANLTTAVRLRPKKNSPKNPVLCYKDFTQRLNTKGKFGLCRILTHCSPKR